MTTEQTKSDSNEKLHAQHLLDALELMAAPVPVRLPEKIAALLPNNGRGFYWRAMTMAEVLRLQGLVNRMVRDARDTQPSDKAGTLATDSTEKATQRLERVSRWADVILLKLSFALCDATGEFVCDLIKDTADWQKRVVHLRRVIKLTDLELIAEELANLNNEEKAQVGKDLPAGLEAGARPATP